LAKDNDRCSIRINAQGIAMPEGPMPTTLHTAVVTGAASVLGVACAEYLASQGYDLILIDADRRRLNGLADALTTRNRKSIEVVQADTRCPIAQAAIVRKIQEDESVSLLVSLFATDGEELHDTSLASMAARVVRHRGRGSRLIRASIVLF
jgi:short-subunit dehydrogenase